MKTYLIKQGLVVDKENNLDGIMDILIKNGKIAKIAKNISDSELLMEEIEIINASGKVVSAGLFDMHVHFREPGQEGKETIKTGMQSCIKGGITSALSMPNTTPPCDNKTIVDYQIKKAQEANLAKLFISGKITREGNLVNMKEMADAGVIALTNDGEDVQDAGLLRKAMMWAKTFNLPILIHAEIESIRDGGHMHEGEVSFLLGIKGIPYSAENLAIEKSIILAEETGCQVHISHISTAYGVEAIKRAKARGVRITCEVCPHHFALTHKECLNWNTNAKMYPPLREAVDIEAILDGLAYGTIDAIATDHAPHAEWEKSLDFADAPNGVIGTETLFSAVNTYLVQKNVISMKEALYKMSVAPAKILGLPAKGLKEGMPADITIFNTDKEWTVQKDDFVSKGKNSAFLGRTLYGQAETVLVNGEIKMLEGEILS